MAKNRDHVRVFQSDDAEDLDRIINKEIESGAYDVTGVSITRFDTGTDEMLTALVSFRIPT